MESEGQRCHGFWGDERSQSVVIGTILVFALGVALLGLLQVTLIPSANEDVEAQHSQQVRGEMQDLRNDIVRSAGSGADFSQGVTLGTDYPTRAFFLNPGPAAGSINTDGTEESAVTLNIEHAQAMDQQTADAWNGSEIDFGTGAVIYRPGYNVYSSAPEATVVENSVVYSEFETGNTIFSSNQRFVDGKQISLTTLDGSLSRSQVNQYTVETNALTPATRTVAIQDDGTEIEITIATRLSEETLIQKVFEDEIDDSDDAGVAGNGPGPEGSDTTCSAITPDPSNDNDRYIRGCDFDDDPFATPSLNDRFNTFTLVMEKDTIYNLKMAKVGVGNGGETPEAYYVTNVEGNSSSILDTGEQQLVVEVRDKYNNPVSGVEVPFEVATSGDIKKEGEPVGAADDEATVKTNEQGQAKVTYIPPDLGGAVPATYSVNVGDSVDTDFITSGDEEYQTTRFDIRVTDATSDAGDIGANINPEGPVRLSAAYTNGEATSNFNSIKCDGNPGGTCVAQITLENTASESINVTGIRYFYFSTFAAPGRATSGIPDDVLVRDLGNSSCRELEFQEDYSTPGIQELDESTGPNPEARILFNFREPTDNFQYVEGDSFGIALKFDDGSKEFSATYLISPELEDNPGSPNPVDGSTAPTSCP